MYRHDKEQTAYLKRVCDVRCFRKLGMYLFVYMKRREIRMWIQDGQQPLSGETFPAKAPREGKSDMVVGELHDHKIRYTKPELHRFFL